jgi:hypothetical protein
MLHLRSTSNLTGACAPPVLADEALTSPPRRTVYLDGPSDLARLRQANPAHYARAERILAEANQLCRPGPGELRQVAVRGAGGL